MPQKKRKKEILFLTAAIALAGFAFFPTEGLFQKIFSAIVFLAVFPFISIHFVLRESVASYGLNLSLLKKKDIVIALLLLLAAIGLFITAFSFTPLEEKYAPKAFLQERFLYFFLYEVLGMGILSLLYSFFFQGFLFFSLQKLFKEWTALVQWGMFCLFLFLGGAFDWNMTLFIYISLFAGYIAHKTQSTPLAWIFSWLFIIFTDILILKFF